MATRADRVVWRILAYAALALVVITVARYWQRWNAMLDAEAVASEARWAAAVEMRQEVRDSMARLAVEAESARARAQEQSQRAADHAAEANRLRRRIGDLLAESPDTNAVARDTMIANDPLPPRGTTWYRLYGLRTEEARQLQWQVGFLERESAEYRGLADRWEMQALRNANTVDVLVDSLAAERARHSGECRILGLVKCPSRTAVAVAGVVGGAVVGYALTRGGKE